MEQLIRNNPIMAILRSVPLDKTLDYVKAVYEGGIHAFEIAMNSPDALQQIELVRKHFGDRAEVGAGTAITLRRVTDALHAGASFLLTPSANPEVLKYCRDNQVRLLPGVMTPTDVDTCLGYGFHVLKLFPAGDLPVGYIKSLKGPFDGTEYIAVGGVGIDNIQSFFEQGFLGVGIASSLIPKEFISNNDWDSAREHVRSLVSKNVKRGVTWE